MTINPYKDETGKPASSKVNPKTGVSDWQKRFIIDKANKIFAKQGGAGTDKGGSFVASEMKKAAAANAAAKKPKPKSKAKPTPKATAMPKSKGPAVLVGEAAAKAMQKRTSPKGVKKFEKGASKALDKKYPGLYKKSK